MNVDNGHDSVLVLIMAMLVNNHDDACWIAIMMMLVNYICICAYMSLVNILTCYWRRTRWCMHVLKYVDVDCWTYALLLSHMFMHSWLLVDGFYIHIGDHEYFVFNYSGWLWCVVGIMWWRP